MIKIRMFEDYRYPKYNYYKIKSITINKRKKKTGKTKRRLFGGSIFNHCPLSDINYPILCKYSYNELDNDEDMVATCLKFREVDCIFKTLINKT